MPTQEPTTGPPESVIPEPPQENQPILSHSKTTKSLVKNAIVTVIVLVVAGGLCVGSYAYGRRQGLASQQAVIAMKQQNTIPPLNVPAGATVISQCTPGEGVQYVLPKDIPMGPIYNVADKKVIGVEYMINQASLNQNTYNLSLSGGTFNHLNIIYEPKGHAGLTAPHDHFVFSTISYSQEQKITCSGQTNTMNMGM